MKRNALFFAVAGMVACGFPGLSSAQSVTLRSSYPVEAPEELKVSEEVSECLPGRGGPGVDPNAARVEIRAVRWPSTKPSPVSADGLSNNDRNPVVRVSRIGAGVSGDRPGRFSVCVPQWALEKADKSAVSNPSSENFSGFFARVYDGPTEEESFYYIDSDMAEYNPNLLFKSLVFSRKSMTPIGNRPDQDWDEDGLSNGFERWQCGTDPFDPDTDKDGFTDGEEYAAGLDPTAPLMFTGFKVVQPAVVTDGEPGDPEVYLEWEGANNSTNLTLEFVADLRDWVTNSITWPVSGTKSENIAEYLSDYPMGFFRLIIDVPDNGDNLSDGTGNGEDGTE